MWVPEQLVGPYGWPAADQTRPKLAAAMRKRKLPPLQLPPCPPQLMMSPSTAADEEAEGPQLTSDALAFLVDGLQIISPIPATHHGLLLPYTAVQFLRGGRLNTQHLRLLKF